MKPHDLLKTAEILLSSGNGRPAAASLRRATSSAYYAVFHCLARNCADLLIGVGGENHRKSAWHQVYRALEHGFAKSQCKNREMIKKFPKNIEDFANIFVLLQEKRHRADYDPSATFLKSEVKADIDQADQAIGLFNAVSAGDRRAFCVYVLLKDRKG